MSQIFINYRRDDEHSSITHSIYNQIENELSTETFIDETFIDNDGIDVGKKISEEIESNLASAKILIVVIGKKWLEILKVRATNPLKDWVKWEISEAIRTNKTIIPVLIDDTIKPAKSELPNAIKGLYDIKSFRLRTDCIAYDISFIIEKIRKILAGNFVDWLKNDLINQYSTQFTTLSSFQHDYFKELSMEEYFITPSYIEWSDLKNRSSLENKETESSRNKIKKQSRNFIHQDYISIKQLSHSQRNIIIGNPGVGKTVFARWLCWNWATKHQELDIIPVYVQLRNLNFQSTQNPLIELLGNKYLKAETVINELKANNDKIIWVLDGYDELPSQNQQVLFTILSQIYQDIEYRCVLLSRPYGLLNLFGFSYNNIFQLDGFTENQIGLYIAKFLKKNKFENDEKQLLEIIENNEVLNNYAHTPLMLSMIINIFIRDKISKRPSTLTEINNQYELQENVFMWLRERELKKASLEKVDRLSNEKKKFAYDLLLDKSFTYEGSLTDGDTLAVGHAFEDINLGKILKFEEAIKWSFSFHSVTFQEYFAAEFINKNLSSEAIFYLQNDRFFWNYSRLLIGLLSNQKNDKVLKDILSYEQDRLNSVRNQYIFLDILAECSPIMVLSYLSEDIFLTIIEIYFISGQYSKEYQPLMVDAFRRLSKKISKSLLSTLRSKLLEQINPTISKQYLEGTLDFYSVPDGVKKLITELSFANDSAFLEECISILSKVLELAKEDEEKAILAYEPIVFILDDIFGKAAESNILALKNDIIQFMNLLPNGYAATVTRLKAKLIKTENASYLGIDKSVVELQKKINNTKRWTKINSEKSFAKLKEITDNLYIYTNSHTLSKIHSQDEISFINGYLELIISFMTLTKDKIDEGEIEEFYQIVAECIGIYQHDKIYDTFLKLIFLLKPDYGSFHFSNPDLFVAWFIEELNLAVSEQNHNKFPIVVFALDGSDYLQLNFMKFSSQFCALLELYANANVDVLNSKPYNYSISFKNEEFVDFEAIKKPLVKITELNRTISNASWTEADKKYLLDFVIDSNFSNIQFFSHHFIPALLGTDFNLFQKKYWNIIDGFIKNDQLKQLFMVIRNRQIFNFSSNIPELINVCKFLSNKLDTDEYLHEHPAWLIEMLSRSMVLVYNNRNSDSSKEALLLFNGLEEILLNEKVKKSFLLEEVKKGLYGFDLYAYLLGYAITQNKSYVIIKDYCKFLKNHNQETREFIDGLSDLLYSSKGFDYEQFNVISSILGKGMVKKIEFYIEEKGFSFKFNKEEFKSLLEN